MDKIITETERAHGRARKAKERSDGCQGAQHTVPINYTTISRSKLFDTMLFSNRCNTYKVASNLSNLTTLRNVSASLPSSLSLILFSVLSFLLSLTSLNFPRTGPLGFSSRSGSSGRVLWLRRPWRNRGNGGRWRSRESTGKDGARGRVGQCSLLRGWRVCS